MSCTRCQSLKLRGLGQWTNGGPQESDVTIYEADFEDWYLLEQANLDGNAFTPVGDGDIIANEPANFVVTLKFQSLMYPAPVKVRFDAVTRDAFSVETARVEITMSLIQAPDVWTSTYTPSLPPAGHTIRMENRRLLVGRLADP